MPLLINRLDPYALESLSSYLERLRQANYYELLGWYIPLLVSPLREHIDCLQDPQHYATLAELTGLSVEQLYCLTIHPFLSSFTMIAAEPMSTGQMDTGIRSWDKRTYRTNIQGSRIGKLCPICWAERRIFLLPWLVRFVTVCPIHHVLLVDTCGMCNFPLHINRVHWYCQRCRTSLADLPTISLENEEQSRGLSKIVWAALTEKDTPLLFSGHSYDSDHPLAHMSPQEFLAFLWRMCQLLTYYDALDVLISDDLLRSGLRWQAPCHGLLSANVLQTHSSLIAIWSLLLCWPESWYKLLKHIISNPTVSLGRLPFPAALFKHFDYQRWGWIYTGWCDFMRAEMFENGELISWLRYYRGLPQEVLPETHSSLLSRREAANALGVSGAQVQQFLDQGKLRTTARPLRPSQRAWQLIEAASVIELRRVRTMHLTLAQVAVRIGISQEQVVALVAANLLQAESGSLVDGRAKWRFDPRAIDTCLNKLLSRLPVRAITKAPYIPVWCFRDIQRIASGRGLRLPRLLQDMQEGIFSVARQQDLLGISVIWCEDDDLRQYLEIVGRSANNLLSAQAVCERLGCKSVTLRRLNSAKLLAPTTSDVVSGRDLHQYAEADVTAFQQRYVTSNEAADLLGVTRLTVQNWTRLGRIYAVTGPEIDGSGVYRFERAELVRWRYERLTFGEAMALLGVSKATLDRWVNQGRLAPLGDMESKQRWFARVDIAQLQK